jgi:GH35 family endo-1,4-beta-xylanase
MRENTVPRGADPCEPEQKALELALQEWLRPDFRTKSDVDVLVEKDVFPKRFRGGIAAIAFALPVLFSGCTASGPGGVIAETPTPITTRTNKSTPSVVPTTTSTEAPTKTAIPQTATAKPAETSTPVLPLEKQPATIAAVTEFANAMKAAGMTTTAEQILQTGLVTKELTGVDGKKYQVASTQDGYPLMMKVEPGRWQEITPGIAGPLFNNINIGISYGNTGVSSIGKRFNTIFEEYDMQWSFQEPTRGTMIYENPGKAAYAEKEINAAVADSKLIMAGHLLTSVGPDWLMQGIKDGSISKAAAIEAMKTRIRTVMSHFKGRVSTWSVLNEYHLKSILPWVGDNELQNLLGVDYAKIAFEEARSVDPNATLLYNDTDNYYPGPPLYDYSFNLVKSLSDMKTGDGKPIIDGVGVQMHIMLNSSDHIPSEQELLTTFLRYKEIGIPVYFTEMDINLQRIKGTDDELKAVGINPQDINTSDVGQRRMIIQGGILRNIASASIISNNVKLMSFFGGDDVTDSWLVSDLKMKEAEATLFKNGNPKFAYYVLLQELCSHN